MTHALALLVRLEHVHLVNQAENVRILRVGRDRLEAALKKGHVLGLLLALDVKHIDQHFDIAKNEVALALEIRLHELFLAERGGRGSRGG
jgi:hypothetical protein